MKNKLKETPQYNVADIQKDIQHNKGIIISYLLVWRRRVFFFIYLFIFELINSYEDSYINLKAYYHQIKIINLKNYVKLEINKKKIAFFNNLLLIMQAYMAYNIVILILI